jgi:hypothetical protein
MQLVEARFIASNAAIFKIKSKPYFYTCLYSVRRDESRLYILVLYLLFSIIFKKNNIMALGFAALLFPFPNLHVLFIVSTISEAAIVDVFRALGI